MYKATYWLDEVTEFDNLYDFTGHGDGTATISPHPGEMIQVGTPQNQDNFNNIERGIFDGNVALSLVTFYSLQRNRIEELDPEQFDEQIAIRINTWANLQQYRENTQDLTADVKDAKNAAAMTAFGLMQEQRRNEARFDLIASEALGEAHTVTLTNTQKFPFNSTLDNPVTVALDTVRKNLFYTVEPEIVANAGPVGDIRVFDKQLNGFKVSFDGSGKNVRVILRVKGGMSHG